jgi:ABC-2 type transport system permease protein
MFIIIYGNMVMRSVIEEKNKSYYRNNISSVKPFQLMIGKIIGTSLAGILQFLYNIGILAYVCRFGVLELMFQQQEYHQN